MAREGFIYTDKEFEQQKAALRQAIEQKYAAQKGALHSETSIREKETDKNFEAFDKEHGTTPKDKENKDAAIKANTQRDFGLIDQAMAKEIAAAEKKLEQSVWTDYGGSRIKAKEAAFGANDPEVAEHRRKQEENKKRQEALEASRKAQERSQMSKDFNKGQARQNVKDQFRDKGGKTNDGKTR